ncbi:DUF262 domain-containing HNH endonuclease family protein [Brachyspira pulli]|uniref:DUF262 domain-containing protein n=1 Tax=Brachyspira pulli TaxID=310721 RepID=UPI0030043BBD
MSNQVAADTFSLNKIIKKEMYFSIPNYQRNYVWKEEQIRKLLEDIENAIINNNNEYYIGSLIVFYRDDDNRYDLVDGQQRFTTICLLLIQIKKIIMDNEFVLKFLDNDKNKKGRLIFRARKFANLFYEENQNSDFDIANKEISHFLNRINSDKSIIPLDSFIKYIAEKLTFVINKMPNKNQMYVNKLFETFNNRGRQLKQHEILKSYLLSKVNNRDIYSIIWDSCSIMDNYIEKNLKDILKIDNETLRKLVNANNRGKYEEKDVGISENIEEGLKSLIKETENQDNLKSKSGHDFYAILERNSDFGDLDNQFENDLHNDSESNYEAPPIRSIISFSMLLLHTLRIFLIENKIKKTVDVKEKELINIFKYIFDDDNISKKTYYFFKLLWKIRVLFDKYVIKFVSDDEDGEVLSICNIIYRKNSRSIERRIDKDNKALSMLQSILYYTQESITQYWLTPFLYQCIKMNDANELYEYLKRMDNILNFYEIKKSKTLSEKTIEISAIDDIYSYYHNNTVNIVNIIEKLEAELQNLNYYGCNRYWFYKLEFILWYNYYNNINSNIFNQNDDNINKKIKEILNKFRITSKNSIEHVYPRDDSQLIDEDKWSDKTKEECLNSFGNLVLISGSLNSELNNKSYKFSILRDKLKKGEVQSLKSLLILKNNKWDENACKEHLKEVIDLYVNYYAEL